MISCMFHDETRTNCTGLQKKDFNQFQTLMSIYYLYAKLDWTGLNWTTHEFHHDSYTRFTTVTVVRCTTFHPYIIYITICDSTWRQRRRQCHRGRGQWRSRAQKKLSMITIIHDVTLLLFQTVLYLRLNLFLQSNLLKIPSLILCIFIRVRNEPRPPPAPPHSGSEEGSPLVRT